MAAAVRLRAWPLVGPVALGALGLLGCATVALVDPSQPGNYPTCPFLALTGQWCPGCGFLRSVRALVFGDPVAALGLNALTVAALPLAGYAYIAWTCKQAGRSGPPILRMPLALLWAAIGATVAFGVLRNVPWEPLAALAP
jgi:hypothetical protein